MLCKRQPRPFRCSSQDGSLQVRQLRKPKKKSEKRSSRSSTHTNIPPGLGVGLLSATIPLYQAETSPKWLRGAIIGSYQLFITVGMFMAGIVDNATKDRNDTGCYRIPIGVQFIFALIIFSGAILLPETPRQLVRQSNFDEAAKSLSRLRRLAVDHPAIVDELAEIRGNHEYEMSLDSASYLTCFRKPLRKRLISGICLQALQQLTGVGFLSHTHSLSPRIMLPFSSQSKN